MSQKTVPIIVLDFGSQYTQLIARRLRESNVYCEIVPYFEKCEDIKALSPKGIILSGGPASIYAENAYKIDEAIWDLGLPMMGICYGMQHTVDHFGGRVVEADEHEYGKASITFDDINGHTSPLFKDVDNNSVVWMSHADRVEELPNGFARIAHSENSPYAAIANEDKNIYCMQYHPEVYHSVDGMKMLQNFAVNICKAPQDWTMANFAHEQIESIRKRVGTGKVLCALSGGVDSSVVTALLYKAIGDNLIPVFVDNGLLRKNEGLKVKEIFGEYLQVPLIALDAEDDFLDELAGVDEPERKRKIIGHKFIELFEKEAKNHDDIKFLAQGTLYPDVIESVSVKGPSKVIKTHHNVGGLPDWMDFELIEPLRELFKDEVRLLGLELGLPHEMVYRHPFPGPGLAVRILGEVTRERCALLREADAIFLEELKSSGYYAKTWQAFAVLMNVKTVGVMGDNRTYENAVAIRCVESTDGMTATFAHLPHDLLETIAGRIINEVNGINRVTYDITSKPPGTIEWE
jgi:GMP synthase (glutamine-hydrolysing)